MLSTDSCIFPHVVDDFNDGTESLSTEFLLLSHDKELLSHNCSFPQRPLTVVLPGVVLDSNASSEAEFTSLSFSVILHIAVSELLSK